MLLKHTKPFKSYFKNTIKSYKNHKNKNLLETYKILQINTHEIFLKLIKSYRNS
jgi:hypothetical protein